ncbi:MAG: hypothetical protein ACR2QC_08125 [Gammaproteobacteria bacterium]
MTVKELKEQMEILIEQGHGDFDVMAWDANVENEAVVTGYWIYGASFMILLQTDEL